MHAPYWNDNEKLVHLSWLRGVGWLNGEDEESWVAYQKRGADCWETAKSKNLAESGVNWDPNVIACLDASIAKATPEAGGWATYQAEIKTRPQTLSHGDFHPANMMIANGERLIMLDFEQVGVGSGPQDLGQYFISHMIPSVRAGIEREAVNKYYETLCALNPEVPKTMSFEQCWSEYVNGGIGRWCWMMPLLATMCPPKMTQYFHDQCKEFMEAHNLTPDNIPMPRV
jgi:aminoglycoside phosphotransferase (APT) family kinase protein